MGCCVSSTEDDGVARPASTKAGQPSTAPVIPEVTWERNTLWTESIEAELKNAVAAGKEAEFRAGFQATIFKRARDWLDEEYAACARAGTIEDMGDMQFPTSYGPCQYPAKMLLALDESFSGVVYASVMVVAMPLEAEWKGDGQSLQSPEIKAAKAVMLAMLADIRQSGSNVNHAVVHIFGGADMVTCKFDATTTEPTINVVSKDPSEEFKKANQRMVRTARQAPDIVRGNYRPMMFRSAIHRRGAEYPGSTIWDEGELPFSVKGSAYPYPTRLLVARDYKKMKNDIDAIHFRVMAPDTDLSERPLTLLRNPTPENDPGGIVSLTLVVATDPNVLWPACGAYVKGAAFKAAEAALHEHVKKLNREGKVQRCSVHLAMGSDLAMYQFVGERFNAPSDESQESEKAAVVPESVAKTALEQKQDGGLEAFSIRLVEQAKHSLFDSESHFQAIKQQIRARAQQNPDFYEAIGPQIAVAAATHFMQANYPGCEVSDEGEFPEITEDGKEIKICDTRLMVARDPKQEPKSVVAAMHVVPRPGTLSGDSSWLDTKEMKAAEEALLGLLKKWHQEGKVSEVDCMAQVMMGMDASIYQFVEGDKFVDYSDERMAQFKWG